MKPYSFPNIERRVIARQQMVEFSRRSASRSKRLCSRIDSSSLLGLLSLLLLVTTLTACSSKSSTDELAKELKTVNSWAATAQTVGDAWTRGDVPEAYAKQTLSKAQEELHKETGKLEKNTATKASKTLLEQLKRLEDTVSKMSTAVEKKDLTAMNQQIQQLSTQEQTISTLAKKAGGEQ